MRSLVSTAQVNFPAALADRLRTKMRAMKAEASKAASLLHKQLKAELTRLDRQEENLIDLAADGGDSVASVRKRLGDIQRRRHAVAERFEQGTERLEFGVRLLDNALTLMDDPQALYRRMSDGQRKLMNLAFFEKLYVEDDQISEAAFRSPFDDLVMARNLAQAWEREPVRRRKKVLVDEGISRGVVADLADIFLGGGSNKGCLVETSGLEPPTPCLQSRCSSN